MADEGQEPQTTLRDALVASFEEHVPTEAPDGKPAPAPAAASDEGAEPAAPAADTRARGPDGKFIEKPKEPAAAPAAATAQKPTSAPASPAPAAVPAASAPAALARPSSWKKELEPQWATLAPEVQKYILQREGEFAKGVSTYKHEWDTAKPVVDAMAPFMPLLQQNGISPDRWISQLGNAHVALAKGTPEQKLSMFLKLAQDYQVPVQQLFARGEDGQVYYNPQVQAYQPPAAPQAQPQAPQDVRKTVQEVLNEERARQSLAAFEADVPTKYQHYETVKADMALLLETGKAQTYEGAYKLALRLHDDLWAAEQQAQSAAAEAERQKQAVEAAQRARRNTVSFRSETPGRAGATSGKKDLRGHLEEAFDEHAGAGRV